MKNQENDDKEIETAISSEKPVWRKPELTEISITETNSGFNFQPMEGTFYGPSGSGGF